jgi:NAD dependent epimerase/dehydratase family enzyme
VGQPNDPKYANSTRLAYNALLRESMAAKFPASMRHHRRGLFAAVNVGLSYGQGQTAPSWLHNDDYDPLADRLLANEHVARMAIFASGKPRLVAVFLGGYSWRHS